MIELIAKIGGLFAVFTFIHFVVDWIFQTHSEAMVKHNNWKVRAKHCIIYTIGFVPLMLMLNYTVLEFVLGLNILFWSHFIEDTYIPVMLWAKYIRQPPEMKDSPKEGFIQFISTPLGKILMIVVDQIIHLAFLFPLVWMAVN
jgi:hypothetical protein